jgi:hypothetical protein
MIFMIIIPNCLQNMKILKEKILNLLSKSIISTIIFKETEEINSQLNESDIFRISFEVRKNY